MLVDTRYFICSSPQVQIVSNTGITDSPNSVKPYSTFERTVNIHQKSYHYNNVNITKDYSKKQSSDPIQSNLINRTFADLGIDPKNTNWIHFGEVNLISDSIRK